MSTDTVHIWQVGTASPLPAALAGLLDGDERRRAAALPDERARSRFVTAHAAVRLIVAGWLGVPPERVRWRHGPHGKPELAAPDPGTQVNLSHSGDLALVAVTDRRPVGVDVQELAAVRDAASRLATRYFPAPEARGVTGTGRDRFVRLWVRKEACVKVAGGRLVQGLRLPVAGNRREVLVCDPSGALPGPFRVRGVQVPAGFRAAVAVAGARPFRVVRHRWTP